MEEEVKKFLVTRQPKLCAIATINELNNPEVTIVGYAVTDNLEIIINTRPTTRKWQNSKSNNNIALVFGWNFDELNVQYEGRATHIEKDSSEFLEIEAFFYSQNPDAAKFKSPETAFIKITPTWIRKLDVTITPPKTDEMTFS